MRATMFEAAIEVQNPSLVELWLGFGFYLVDFLICCLFNVKNLLSLFISFFSWDYMSEFPLDINWVGYGSFKLLSK